MDRVKFYKCSREEYERAKEKGLVDQSAFYFVVEESALYAGQEMIVRDEQEKEYKEM